MDIIALQPGAIVTIKAVGKEDTLEFQSQVVEPYGNTILIEEIQNANGEAIGFMTENVYLEMSSINSKNLPIIWKNVEIRHVRRGKNFYHRVIQSEGGKVYNRRAAYRLNIDKGATIQKGVNAGVIDVLMHDVSTSGFSFITEQDFEVSGTDTIRLVCQYEDFKINVTGVLVRKQSLATGKILYGVKMTVLNRQLDKFIMERQRQKANLNRKPQQENQK